MIVPLTPRLCRAARALAGFEQKDLASASDVAKSTIGAFEIKDESARLGKRTNRALVEAFERAGLVFIPENGGGPGVRFRDPISRAFDTSLSPNQLTTDDDQ
jgi:transcriptional regulator with XRE-family HTH domain